MNLKRGFWTSRVQASLSLEACQGQKGRDLLLSLPLLGSILEKQKIGLPQWSPSKMCPSHPNNPYPLRVTTWVPQGAGTWVSVNGLKWGSHKTKNSQNSNVEIRRGIKMTWPFRAFLRLLPARLKWRGITCHCCIAVCFCPGFHSAVLMGSSLSDTWMRRWVGSRCKYRRPITEGGNKLEHLMLPRVSELVNQLSLAEYFQQDRTATPRAAPVTRSEIRPGGTMCKRLELGLSVFHFV